MDRRRAFGVVGEKEGRVCSLLMSRRNAVFRSRVQARSEATSRRCSISKTASTPSHLAWAGTGFDFVHYHIPKHPKEVAAFIEKAAKASK